MARRSLTRTVIAAMALLIASCSGDGDTAAPTSSTMRSTTSEAPSTTVADTTTTTTPRTVPTVSSAPDGVPENTATGSEDFDTSYDERELFVSGTATSYRPVGDLGDDGEWDVAPADDAPFHTRILVRTPRDASAFSGFVIVEWNNVTIGQDSTPDWSYVGAEIMRRSHAYVAVSAQKVGIDGTEGGGLSLSSAGGLRDKNPERYGALEHPGDAFSYDIFGQVLEAIRAGSVLGDLDPDFVIAIGESQSAFRLTTYINAVHTFHPFDSYLVHSRGGGAASLDDDSLSSGVVGAVRIRDVGVPVLVFSAETDVKQLGYARARQPDGPNFRSWEVAGTAHADAFLLGGDPGAGAALGCDGLINDGPQYLVLRAALAQLVDWTGVGIAPPSHPPLELASTDPIELRRDDDGIAIGGIRTPLVDVPIAVLTGDPVGGSPLCGLFGSTTFFDDLQSRYGTRERFSAQFEAAIDEAVDAGVLLVDDLDALRAEVAGADF